MSIDRGYGIATSAVIADSYDLDALIADTEAAKVAAEAAQAAAETAQTAAETAETNAETAETNAAASASAAATSETNIGNAETNCSNSATAAAASETAAAASETAAAASETAAAASETAAATSETNAATSETNAASSASSASTSATSASSSASSASTSATNAASSASAASTSETNAAASATSASTSASTATTQASNASTSASAAATSASNASTSETNAATSASNASTAQTAAEAAQAAAEAAADNFDDTYLGAKASDPTVDNDGDALSAGDLYFNTTSNVMKYYTGSAWVNIAAETFTEVSQDTTPQLGGDLDTNGNNVNFGDNDNAQFGASNDLQIYHNGTHSYLKNATGDIVMQSDGTDKGIVIRADDGSGGATSYIIANGSTGAVDLYNYGDKKLATTSTGIDVTGTVTADGITNDGNISTDTARSADVVDNDGSFDLDAGTNFTCTPTGNITLTFTNIPDGQSGTIVLVNTGGHTISAHTNTKVMGADMLTTITTAGTYVLGYISDSSVVRVYNSGAQQ